MSVDINFKWNKPLNLVISNDAGINKSLMLFAAEDWHRLYYDFVPMRTGMLASDVSYDASNNKATITHKVPYAQYQYYGAGFHFSHDAHPLASAEWDKAAKAMGRGRTLTGDMQRFIKRG